MNKRIERKLRKYLALNGFANFAIITDELHYDDYNYFITRKSNNKVLYPFKTEIALEEFLNNQLQEFSGQSEYDWYR